MIGAPNLSLYTGSSVNGSAEQDRARSALLHIDPSCARHDWVMIGLAAKAAGLTFDDFHGWSVPANNYAGESDCRAAWKSFKPDGGVTAATLFKAARDQGWKDLAAEMPYSMGAHITSNGAAVMKQATTAEKTKALQVWEVCESAPPDHPYIIKKCGKAEGLRIYPTSAPELTIRDKAGLHCVAGWLVVPCLADGLLKTLQFIASDGRKLNLPGASFHDGFFVIGQVKAGGVVYLAEGLGQAWASHTATGAAAVVTFGAGRLAVVAGVLRTREPSARLVLLPDRGKETLAQEIAGKLDCAWCELPADKPLNYDVNDYWLEHGIAALQAVLQKVMTVPLRFRLLSGADLFALPPLRWMVHGVLPVEGLAALYGPSGAGKSFLVLDLAASIAGGHNDWFGRRVTQHPVTYCALEGEAGMGKRVSAWSQHHQKPVPEALRFVAQSFNLLAEGDIIDLAKAVRAAGSAPGLVIIDTLNRAAPGADENSSVDMGNLIAAAKRLQKLTGGLVLLVHHSGKDPTKGLRGHSSLYAALDGAIEVSKMDGRREWSVAKSKDDETGQVQPFSLEVVAVGHDHDGQEITSCVVVADDSRGAAKRVKLPQGGNQKIAMDTLSQPLRESKVFGQGAAPSGRPCLRLDEAVVMVADKMPCEAKRRTERAQSALNALVAKNIYGVKEGWLWRV